MVFEIIKNWIIANIDLLIQTSIVSIVVSSFFKALSISYKKMPKIIIALKNIKGIKYLEGMLLYALPLGTIGVMIIDQTIEPTFKNIALFIVVVATLIFNILIGHIRTLYKLNTDLIKANSKKMTNIDQTFTKVYEHIEKTRTKE